MMSAPPADSQRLVCPACGRYLCTADGTYVECPPCQCGWQATMRAVGKRARQCVEMGGEHIEVKASRT